MSLIMSYHSNLILEIKTKPSIPLSYLLFFSAKFLFFLQYFFSILQISTRYFPFWKKFSFQKIEKKGPAREEARRRKRTSRKKRTEKKGIPGLVMMILRMRYVIRNEFLVLFYYRFSTSLPVVFIFVTIT
jgi:hypothetical protein